MHGRVTVAAVAAGAFVAAGQTLAGSFLPADAAEQEAAAALLPVSDVTAMPTPTVRNYAVEAIGGNQLLPDSTTPGALAAAQSAAGPGATARTASAVNSSVLDPGAALDISSLVKAADLGQQLAKQTAILNQALAGGAPQGVLFNGAPFILPTLGRLTSGFGGRWGTTHYGIDLAAPIGTPIYALTDGVVEDAGPASGFGLWVVLKHPDGTHSVYGHVNRMFVKVGDVVKAGQQIAEVGNRGESTGPHLHLEIWDVDGTKVDPIPWLTARGIQLPPMTG
jgi:murein DD-endopeptidase MepM/ murein hydrolase activator NlpD